MTTFFFRMGGHGLSTGGGGIFITGSTFVLGGGGYVIITGHFFCTGGGTGSELVLLTE